VVTRVYSPATHSYESEAQYEQRLRADLSRSVQRIEQHLACARAPSSGRMPPTTS
jgi:biofilm PGA synthesis lipoprotein PgaB